MAQQQCGPDNSYSYGYHHTVQHQGSAPQRGMHRRGAPSSAAPSGSTSSASLRTRVGTCLAALCVGCSVSVLLLFVVLPRGVDGRVRWSVLLPGRSTAASPLHMQQGGSASSPSSAHQHSKFQYNAAWWLALPGMSGTLISDGGGGPAHVPDELRNAPQALMTHEQLRVLQDDLKVRMRAARSGNVASGDGGTVVFNQSSVGILLVAKHRQLLSAYVNLRVLREHLQSTLPVEVVWHGPTEAPPVALQKVVAAIPGVRLIDSNMVMPPGPFVALGKGLPDEMSFRAKAWALAFATTFTHVLLLDSDNLPLVEPSRLFRLRQYKQHGNLFWPDWWGSHHSQPSTQLSVSQDLYHLFNLPVPWTKEGRAAAEEEAAKEEAVKEATEAAPQEQQQGQQQERLKQQMRRLREAAVRDPEQAGQAPSSGEPAAGLDGGASPRLLHHWLPGGRGVKDAVGSSAGGGDTASSVEGGLGKEDAAEGEDEGPPRFLCTESGQVLLDRSRHMDVLIWMWWLMMQPHITRLAHGDKDLYRVAFSLAHKSAQFQQVSIPARCAVAKGPHSVTFMGMVQLSPQGRPLFHHRTGPAKYFHNEAHPHASMLEGQRVSMVSSPLSHDSAYRVVGRWFWPNSMVDLDPWERKRCALPPELMEQLKDDSSSQAGGSSTVAAPYPPVPDVPEAWCTKLGEGLPRLPVWPLERFGGRGQVIEVAHQVMVQVARTRPELLAR